MNEVKIDQVCDGKCAECSQEKNGVQFRFTFFQKAFLCWEHFRLLQESLKPGRVERVVEIRSWDCCCRSCCCRHGRTYTRSSYGVCESVTEGRSRGESIGESQSETRSSGHSISRSSSTSSSRSSGQSEGETR